LPPHKKLKQTAYNTGLAKAQIPPHNANAICAFAKPETVSGHCQPIFVSTLSTRDLQCPDLSINVHITSKSLHSLSILINSCEGNEPLTSVLRNAFFGACFELSFFISTFVI
jgi:hypothetical protein